MLLKEGENLVPAVHRLLLPIGRPVIVEETMARIRIHVKLIGLAALLQFLLVAGHLFGRGALVLLTKEAQERAGWVLGVVDRGHGLLGREFLPGHYDTPAPAVHGGVKAFRTTRREIRVSAPRTGAEDAHFAVDGGERAQVSHCSSNIAHDLVVGLATCRAYFRRHDLGG